MSVEPYEGPAPQTDHDYIVGSYHLLASLNTKVREVETKQATQDTKVETLERTVNIHSWMIGLVTAVSVPLVIVMLNFITSHLH